MGYIARMRWTVETHQAVDVEIEALPPGLQARLVRLLEAVENIGLENLREPHVKHLEGKLWELRAKASEGIARGIYVTVTGRKVIVLHVFVKKSQKTPTGALDLARKRMREMTL
jgi:phage-related protein